MNGYNWPENIHEIEAFVERMPSLNDSPTILYDDIVHCINNIRGIVKAVILNTPSLIDSHLENDKILINLGAIKEMETDIISHVNAFVNADKDKLEQIFIISKTTLWR